MPTPIKYIAIAIVLIIAFFVLNPIVIIGAGQRGVVFNNASGIEDKVLGEGLHFRAPFVQSVKTMPVKVGRNDINAEAGSKDLQVVNTVITVNWRLDPNQVHRVYQTIGNIDDVLDRIVVPAVNETVKASVAQKTAEEVLTKRPELKGDIEQRLSERLKTYNVILTDVSIVDVKFSAEFDKAIEQKQIAQQESQRAEFIANQKTAEARGEVERAKGIAESQRLIQQTITPELLEKLKIEKWNGQLPQYVVGDGQSLIINPVK